MTAPKLCALGVVLDIADGRVYVDVNETTEGEALGMLVTPDEQAAYRPLVMKDSAIRITIEPADAPERKPVTIEQIKARLRAALERNMGERVRSVPAGDIATDLADEVAALIREANSPEEPHAHGSPLDYLGQLSGLLAGLAEVHASQSDEQNSRAVARCKSLANSASLALLAERRAAR